MGLTKSELNKRWNLQNPEKARAISLRKRLKDPEKARQAIRDWRKNNYEYYLEKSRQASRKCNFGITQDEFEAMIKVQKNRCAICKEVFWHTPHVDHCHKTGYIRKLLCRQCNHLLGNAKDKIKILQLAIDYLKRREYWKSKS